MLDYELKEIVRYMDSIEHSSQSNTSIILDDWMEESIDKFLISIEQSKDILDCVPGPQSDEVREIPQHAEIKDTCVPSHDHIYTSLDQNSNETMLSKDNETLCGFTRIPTVVMTGSHSSSLHLNSHILKEDHVALSSFAHHDIPHKDEEYLEKVK